MTALAGDDENPGIPGFDPDVGAELYTTNGDTNDHMYQSDRVQSFTPEGSPGVGTGSGFIFQDVEADVQEEFEKHVQFALDLARSADRPVASGQPPRQQGAELRRGRLQAVLRQPADRPGERPPRPRQDQLRYQVNGGRRQTKSTSEWGGGLRYGDEGDYWYHRMRGQVTGTDPGDTVEVWFTARGRSQERLVHLQGALGLERGRARARGGGLQREQRVAAVRPTRRSRTTSATTPRRSGDTPHDVYDYDAEEPQGAGPARRAEPLRRGDLVHGQRQRHARRAQRRAWRTWRRTARSPRCVTS